MSILVSLDMCGCHVVVTLGGVPCILTTTEAREAYAALGQAINAVDPQPLAEPPLGTCCASCAELSTALRATMAYFEEYAGDAVPEGHWDECPAADEDSFEHYRHSVTCEVSPGALIPDDGSWPDCATCDTESERDDEAALAACVCSQGAMIRAYRVAREALQEPAPPREHVTFGHER